MAHPPVTVVIPVWNAWEHTRRCLDSLRPTLNVRDEVVVVDNGSTDATAAGLRRYPWARVVTNPENPGFAAACNQGAAVARNEFLVVLNNDTVLPARWLDPLLRPFADPAVVATGPRSNAVSGPQLVPNASYDGGRVAELNRFARRWREEHRGQVSETGRLVGFCLAVRRSSFEAAGGFDETFGIGGFEDDDLCRRLVQAGGRLLIAHESFVHHEGHQTLAANGLDWYDEQQRNAEVFADKPILVSACLIVRDEEEMLPDCLASLSGLVDEVVVYDTGSTDATKKIAAAAGAMVVDGDWDDDFARARNAALEHCRGRWVLHVDADERVRGDVAALRARLRREPAQVMDVRIDNVAANDVVGMSHRFGRLFRRGCARWANRLHEHLVPLPGKGPLVRTAAHEVTLTHLGYRSDVFAARDKAARNLRLAERMADGDDVHPAVAALQLGRALLSAGRLDEAAGALDDARSHAAALRLVRQVAVRHGIEALVQLDRRDEARRWLDGMRAADTTPQMRRWLSARVLRAQGRPSEAVELLAGLGEVTDVDGYAVPEHRVCSERGRLLADLDRWAEAAQELERAVVLGSSDVTWDRLADACARAGYPPTNAIDVIPAERYTEVIGQILAAPPEASDHLLEAWHARRPDHRAVLAAAAVLAPRLPLPRAMEWSARLRSAGLHDVCPLPRIAADPNRDPVERLEAAAVLVAAFGDDVTPLVARTAPVVPVERLREAVHAVGELSPDLLPDVVAAAATDEERCLTLAAVADELDAAEAAAALRAQAARFASDSEETGNREALSA